MISALNAEVAKWNLDHLIAAKRQPYWASVDVVDEYTVRINVKKWINTIFESFESGT